MKLDTNKYFANLNKVTACRLAGTIAGAAITGMVTKNNTVAGVVLALAVVNVGIKHSRAVTEGKDNLEETYTNENVSRGELLMTGLANAAGTSLLGLGANKLFGKKPAPVAPATPVV